MIHQRHQLQIIVEMNLLPVCHLAYECATVLERVVSHQNCSLLHLILFILQYVTKVALESSECRL